MSDRDGLNNNLVEYAVINFGLIAKAQSFIIDCEYFKAQKNLRFSAREVSFPCRFKEFYQFFFISSA